ncbi:MAG: LemA family protein [Paludibacteraceae bacterium]|nr:LemA family protein [Paludibacteraceae bacterium]
MKTIKKLLFCLMLVPFLSSCQYNEMVEMQEKVEAQWGQVENVYQRRADLIPNLVEVVKGYAKHEHETLTEVTKARAEATSIKLNMEDLTEENLAKYQEAQGAITQALSRLMVAHEQYPELKADKQFQALQAQLEGTENRISTERNRFNEIAREYNTYIKKFPNNFIAGWFDFNAKPYFKADAGSEKAPKIQF